MAVSQIHASGLPLDSRKRISATTSIDAHARRRRFRQSGFPLSAPVSSICRSNIQLYSISHFLQACTFVIAMGDLLDELLAKKKAEEDAEHRMWVPADKPMDPWELSSFNPFSASETTSATDALLAFADRAEQHAEEASSSSRVMETKPKQKAKKETMTPAPPAEAGKTLGLPWDCLATAPFPPPSWSTQLAFASMRWRLPAPIGPGADRAASRQRAERW